MLDERRGHGGNDLHPDRERHYCSECKATSVFQVDHDRKIMQCVGDQRSPTPRPGCGKAMPYSPYKKMWGDCLTRCRAVRRAFKCPDGKYYCCVCLGPLENVAEFSG